jgi:hypothetical protein
LLSVAGQRKPAVIAFHTCPYSLSTFPPPFGGANGIFISTKDGLQLNSFSNGIALVKLSR